jgi:hypothetical protein
LPHASASPTRRNVAHLLALSPATSGKPRLQGSPENLLCVMDPLFEATRIPQLGCLTVRM